VRCGLGGHCCARAGGHQVIYYGGERGERKGGFLRIQPGEKKQSSETTIENLSNILGCRNHGERTAIAGAFG